MSLRDDEEQFMQTSQMEDEEGLSEKELKKLRKAKKKAQTEEKERNKAGWIVFLEYVRVICIGALVAFLLCRFVIINAEVPTSSMVPTINVGDRMIGLRLTYYFTDPKRGDVVIFKCPDEAHLDELYVKRVIGLPGETVEIRAGQVIITTVDNEVTYLTEDYLNEKKLNDTVQNNRTYVLGENEYFMMGDNRNRSSDSRYWGPVTRDRIMAKCLFKYFKGFKIIK